MRFAAAGDATLLIGGDLIVTVCQVMLMLLDIIRPNGLIIAF